MLPPIKAKDTLEQFYGYLNPDRISTNDASVILKMESGTHDIDWHSLVIENRRSDWPESSMKSMVPRGNRNRYTRILCHEDKGKMYYRLKDLRYWLEMNSFT